LFTKDHFARRMYAPRGRPHEAMNKEEQKHFALHGYRLLQLLGEVSVIDKHLRNGRGQL